MNLLRLVVNNAVLQKNPYGLVSLPNVGLESDWRTVFFVEEVPGYYKRNRHFQCCIETKLLMI